MHLDWYGLHRPAINWPIWHLPQIPDWCFPLFLGLLSLWLFWNGFQNFEKGVMNLPRGGGTVYRDKQPVLFWFATAYTAFIAILFLGSSAFSGQELIQRHLLSACDPKDQGTAAYYRTVAANCLEPAHATWATNQTKKLAHENRGFALLRAGAYQPAIEDLSAAIALEPANEWAFLTRGRANIQARKFKEALSDLDTAVKLSPDDLAALRLRSDLYVSMGRATKAIADMNRVAAVKPNDPVAWRALSFAHAEKGDCVISLNFADKAIALGDKSFWPHKSKAICYGQMGRTDDQLDEYAKAITQEPKNLELYQARAAIYFRTDNYEAAIEELSRAIQIAPKNPALLYQRCSLRALSGLQLERALDDCNEFLKVSASSPVVREARAIALYRLKRYAMAESECDKILAKNPQSSTAHYIRGLARKELGNKYSDGDIELAKELNSSDVSSLMTYGLKP